MGLLGQRWRAAKERFVGGLVIRSPGCGTVQKAQELAEEIAVWLREVQEMDKENAEARRGRMLALRKDAAKARAKAEANRRHRDAVAERVRKCRNKAAATLGNQKYKRIQAEKKKTYHARS